MRLLLRKDEQSALEAAQAHRPKVRHWRRFQAVLWRAEGMPVAVGAKTLRCTEARV